MNKSVLNRKLLQKRNVLILVIAIIFIYSFGTIFFTNMRNKKWGDELRHYTDNFIELLIDQNYQSLFEKYASCTGKDVEDLKNSFEELYQSFGIIKSYKYAGASSSSYGQFGPLTSFYLNYQMTFDSGKIYQGDFKIAIDQKANAPEHQKILGFGVNGDLDKDEIFYIPLHNCPE